MLYKNATYLAMIGDFYQIENLVQHLSIFTPHLVFEFSRSLLAECSKKKKKKNWKPNTNPWVMSFHPKC